MATQDQPRPETTTVPDTAVPPVYSAKARIGAVQRGLPTVTTVEEFGKAIEPYVSSMAEHTSATSVLTDTLFRIVKEFQGAAYDEVARLRQQGDRLGEVCEAVDAAAGRFLESGAQFWIQARRESERLFIAVVVCTCVVVVCEGTRAWIAWSVLDNTKTMLANQGVLYERIKAIETKGAGTQARVPSKEGK